MCGEAASITRCSRLATRNSKCTSVYIILRAWARQKQLAKFNTSKILLRLELPGFRQRIAQIRALNLARTQ
jgi:hypothetical protein